jgi:hypothetical protein
MRSRGRCDERIGLTIPDPIGSLRRIAQGRYDDGKGSLTENGLVLAGVLKQAVHLNAMPLDEFVRTLRDLEARGLLAELQKRL